MSTRVFSWWGSTSSWRNLHRSMVMQQSDEYGTVGSAGPAPRHILLNGKTVYSVSKSICKNDFHRPLTVDRRQKRLPRKRQSFSCHQLFHFVDPAFRAFDFAHLDASQGLVQSGQHRAHFFHPAGDADFLAVVHHFAHRADDGSGTAQAGFGKSATSENFTGRCSTFMPSISVAMVIRERRVMEGRMESDFGVTRVPSFSRTGSWRRRFLPRKSGWPDPGTCFHRTRCDGR